MSNENMYTVKHELALTALEEDMIGDYLNILDMARDSGYEYVQYAYLRKLLDEGNTGTMRTVTAVLSAMGVIRRYVVTFPGKPGTQTLISLWENREGSVVEIYPDIVLSD